jgi:hypothetical protein
MNGYTEDKRIGASALGAYAGACLLLFDIKEPYPGYFRCHEVVRFVYRYMKKHDTSLGRLMRTMRVVDGVFAGVEHSWIELAPDIILDVYAVARVPMVQLIDAAAYTLLPRLFKEGPYRTDIDESKIEELQSQIRNEQEEKCTQPKKKRARTKRGAQRC